MQASKPHAVSLVICKIQPKLQRHGQVVFAAPCLAPDGKPLFLKLIFGPRKRKPEKGQLVEQQTARVVLSTIDKHVRLHAARALFTEQNVEKAHVCHFHCLCREDPDARVTFLAQKPTARNVPAVAEEVLGLEAEVALDNDDDLALAQTEVLSAHRGHVLVEALESFLGVFGLQQVSTENLFCIQEWSKVAEQTRVCKKNTHWQSPRRSHAHDHSNQKK